MKKICFSMASLLVAVFAALVLAEGGYRIYILIAQPVMKPSGIKNLGWELTPGAHRHLRGRDGNRIEFMINRKGFRDSSSAAWRSWGREDLKVLFLGDSVTEGAQVKYEETYSAQAEKYLRMKGISARTVNYGIAATNTTQHLALLKARGLPLGPDKVILGFFLNDTERRAVDKIPSFLEILWRRFYFGQFLVCKILSWRQNKGIHQPDNPESLKASILEYQKNTIRSYEEEGWRLASRSLGEMRKVCSENRIFFGVVIFPFEAQISSALPNTPQKKIIAFLSRENVPYLDMLEVFKAERGKSSERFYPPSDPFHPNARGHEVAGQAIAEWLTAQ